jgi:hypothetical protein
MAIPERACDVACQPAGMMYGFDEGLEPDVPVEQFGFYFKICKRVRSRHSRINNKLFQNVNIEPLFVTNSKPIYSEKAHPPQAAATETYRTALGTAA